FQAYYGLSATGIADEKTQQKLDEVYNSPYQKGKRNSYTSEIKMMLNVLGYDGLAEGPVFGSLTETRVKEFQRDNGLKAHGIADERTISLLEKIYKPAIILIKQKLNALGFDGIAETGNYGSWTATRVKQFQVYYGLPETGIADRKTQQKLNDIYNSPYQRGKSNPFITEIKKMLNALGYNGLAEGPVFGGLTETRVKQFQEDNGLKAHGIVDEVTINKLNDVYSNRNTIYYSDVTLEQALNIQMNQLQQTDKYRNEPAYIHSNYVNIERTGAITDNGVRLRTSPDFNNNIVYTVNSGTSVIILDEVSGALHQGSKIWYKLLYNGTTLYVHSSLANPNALVAITTANVNVRAEANSSSHKYGVIPKGTTVNIVKEGGTWHQIDYGSWRNPTRADVLHYLNPNNNDMFQHLVLSESVGVSATSLNNVLKGKGILDGEGQAFINAAKKHAVNEVYLISHALLETGHGKSDLANGIEVGLNKSGNPVLVTSSNRTTLTSIKPTYNMFGIGAVDGNARTAGAIRAYREKWFTPEDAIVGGAKFIGERYIHNAYNQNTLYKMRWNPANPGYPQYATDIAWATKQVNTIKNMYSQLDNPLFHFNIVQYK
ncbi:peptidoglycan-binding protein, partial [Oceanobacillus profundus]